MTRIRIELGEPESTLGSVDVYLHQHELMDVADYFGKFAQEPRAEGELRMIAGMIKRLFRDALRTTMHSDDSEH